ncbi:IS110 family transposase [Photorhabdus laumondii]
MTIHSNDELSWLTKLERIQCLYRVRQRLMKNRTALINQIRGLGLEYGITMPESAHKGERCLPEHLKNAENELTVLSRQLFQELLFELKDLQQSLKELDKRFDHLNAQHEDVCRLLTLLDIGPLGASALMIALGDSQEFKNGRHFASYLGLVPKKHSSGGKTQRLDISKQGNAYLRRILIHGTRSVVYQLSRRPD